MCSGWLLDQHGGLLKHLPRMKYCICHVHTGGIKAVIQMTSCRKNSRNIVQETLLTARQMRWESQENQCLACKIFARSQAIWDGLCAGS